MRTPLPRRRGRTALTAAAIVGAVAVAAGAVTFAVGRPGSPPTPAARPSPSAAPSYAPTPLPTDAPTPTAAGLAAALTPLLADRALGTTPVVQVVDARSGAVLFDRNGAAPLVPASTLKLLTGIAALADLGGDTRLRTTVRGPVPAPDGTVADAWLVGAGDPTLATIPLPGAYPVPASLDDLAAQVAARGAKRIGALHVDAGLFTGPAMGPGWKPTYVTGGSVTPVSALEVDGGRIPPGTGSRTRVPDAALSAGQAFAAALVRHGVAVGPAVTPSPAAPGAGQLAASAGPTVAGLVEVMLQRSDNDVAESLGRLVALHEGLPASFDGETAALTRVAARLGLPTAGVALSDASGLSPQDRLPPAMLLAALRVATVTGPQELRAVVAGLPVPAFSGTLAPRYRTAPVAAAAGRVLAKTGTLAGVSGETGQVVDADGRVLLVAAYAQNAPGLVAAEAALDRLFAATAACGCR
ncbi:MAG TPA: D-alanyl-D-alanine carboxypeptidase [Frankiaceae bacterium]